jgi:hypothetical protein
MSDETFMQKFMRKSKKEPLVPIGVLATTAFLIAGLRSFHSGTKSQAQMFMRGRVLAQGFTVLALSWGAFYGMKPHDRPTTMEEVLERNNRAEVN